MMTHVWDWASVLHRKHTHSRRTHTFILTLAGLALTETTYPTHKDLLVIDQHRYWQISANHQKTGQSSDFLCWCVCVYVSVPKVSLLSLCFLLLPNSVHSVCSFRCVCCFLFILQLEHYYIDMEMEMSSVDYFFVVTILHGIKPVVKYVYFTF